MQAPVLGQPQPVLQLAVAKASKVAQHVHVEAEPFDSWGALAVHAAHELAIWDRILCVNPCTPEVTAGDLMGLLEAGIRSGSSTLVGEAHPYLLGEQGEPIGWERGPFHQFSQNIGHRWAVLWNSCTTPELMLNSSYWWGPGAELVEAAAATLHDRVVIDIDTPAEFRAAQLLHRAYHGDPTQ